MVVRKLKLADKQSNGERALVRVPKLERVEALLEKNSVELGAEELQDLIDSWAEIDKQAKHLAYVAKRIKDAVQERANMDNWRTMAGRKFEAEVGDTVKTVVVGTPTDLARLLKKEKRMELFNTIVSIKVGEAKKLLGTDALEKNGIIKFETKEKDRVIIRPIKE